MYFSEETFPVMKLLRSRRAKIYPKYFKTLVKVAKTKAKHKM